MSAGTGSGRAAVAAGSLVLALLVLLYAARYGVSLSDGGWSATMGLRALRGEVPHRDYFSLVGPVTAWVVALAFRLSSVSLHTVAITAALVEWATLLGLAAISRRGGLSWKSVTLLSIVYVTCSPALSTGFFSVSYGNLCLLLAVGIALIVSFHASPRRSFLAGILFGLLFLTKHTFVAFLGTAVFLFWVTERALGRVSTKDLAGNLLALSVGSAAVVGSWALYLRSQEALVPAYENMILAPLHHFSPVAVFAPYHFSTRRTGLMAILAYARNVLMNSLWLVPPAACVAGVLAVRRRIRMAPPALLLLLIASMLSTVLYYPVLSGFWIRIACVFAWIPLLYAIQESRGALRVGAGAILLYALGLNAVGLLGRTHEGYRYIDLPRVRLYGSAEDDRLLREVSAYVGHHPARTLAAFPFYPSFAFVFGLDPATGLDSWFPTNATEEEALAYLRPLRGASMIAVVNNGPGGPQSRNRRFSEVYPRVYRGVAGGRDPVRAGTWEFYYLTGESTAAWDALALGARGAVEGPPG